MYTKLKKIQEGFTIVEVLIVLAIAALILAIVLIAVPDLQRSSRNTNILHDAQNVASGVQSYEGNNQGTLPWVNAGVFTAPATNPATNSSTFTVGSTGAEATAHVQTNDSIFVSNGVNTVTYSATGTAPSATKITQGEIVIDDQTDCASTPGNAVTTVANTRAVAVMYPIEGSSLGSSSVGCVQE